MAGKFLAASGGGGLGWFGWGGWGLPAGVSACGEVAGWGVWLLGLRLAQVAAGAGGCGCWGFGLRGWLARLASARAQGGSSAGGGGCFGLRGVAGSAREAACWLRLGDLSQLAGVLASAWGLARFGLGRVVGVWSARSQSVLVSASCLGCRSAQGRP